jgi:hypothetical protein
MKIPKYLEEYLMQTERECQKLMKALKQDSVSYAFNRGRYRTVCEIRELINETPPRTDKRREKVCDRIKCNGCGAESFLSEKTVLYCVSCQKENFEMFKAGFKAGYSIIREAFTEEMAKINLTKQD